MLVGPRKAVSATCVPDCAARQNRPAECMLEYLSWGAPSSLLFSVWLAGRDVADNLQFVPVALDSLRPNTALEFDLYLRSDPLQPVVLFREQNYPLEERDVRSLSESGIDSLYISAQQAESFERYVPRR